MWKYNAISQKCDSVHLLFNKDSNGKHLQAKLLGYLRLILGLSKLILEPSRQQIRAFYSAPRGEGDADFKICGPATQKNYGNATAAPPEPGRNFGPAFGGAQYSKQNKNKL